MICLKCICRHVQEQLSPDRYRHSLNVARRAVQLAPICGADTVKAQISGLLHDVCKDMPPENQLKYLRSHGILLDDLTLFYPEIWHAVTGSVYIHDKLGIDDDDICNAVRWHTTGKAAMSPLDITIYLADLTSDDRHFPDSDIIRALSELDPLKALCKGIAFSIRKVLESEKPVVREAWEAYNYYIRGMTDEL